MTLIHQLLQIKYFNECYTKCQWHNNVMRNPIKGNNQSKGKSKRHNVKKKIY